MVFFEFTPGQILLATPAGGIPSLKQYACFSKHVRHLGSFPRGKGYFASRVNYYSNSNCSFHLIRLIVSGDISVNPGPEKCAVCLKIVARNHRALSCDHCDSCMVPHEVW